MLKVKFSKRKNIIELSTHDRDKLLELIFKHSTLLKTVFYKNNTKYFLKFINAKSKNFTYYVFVRARKNIYPYKKIVVFINPFMRLLLAIVYYNNCFEIRYIFAKTKESSKEIKYKLRFKVTKLKKEKVSNKFLQFLESSRKYSIVIKNIHDPKLGDVIYRIGTKMLKKMKEILNDPERMKKRENTIYLFNKAWKGSMYILENLTFNEVSTLYKILRNNLKENEEIKKTKRIERFLQNYSIQLKLNHNDSSIDHLKLKLINRLHLVAVSRLLFMFLLEEEEMKEAVQLLTTKED